MFAIDHHEFHPVLKQLHELLILHKLTLSTAESCTGGLISSLLTNMSGSSQYFLGGVCSYSNESKHKLLNVPEDLILKHGAVSEIVAKSMAEGARTSFAAHYSIAVTGIAGPGGGTPDKPVGTVFVAFCLDRKTKVERLQLSGDRDSIRAQICLFALANLYQRILSDLGAKP